MTGGKWKFSGGHANQEKIIRSHPLELFALQLNILSCFAVDFLKSQVYLPAELSGGVERTR